MENEELSIKGKYLNAKQVWEAYGISRGMLGRLVESGKVERKVIADEFATLNLYLASDIEKAIGGCGNGTR